MDFKNTVVIMTSNVATPDIKRHNLGFALPRWGEATTAEDSEEAQRRARALEGLRRAFRPEFLNRIDQIVVFESLTHDDLRQIVDLLLGEGEHAGWPTRSISLAFGDDLRELPDGRGLRRGVRRAATARAIQTHVDDTLADAILAGTVQPGQTAHLSVVDGAVQVRAEGEPRIVVTSTPSPSGRHNLSFCR